MTIIRQANFETASGELKNYDTKILVGYVASAILLLIAIYLASMSSGTTPNEFASMAVFP
jgi:hypothetical protein